MRRVLSYILLLCSVLILGTGNGWCENGEKPASSNPVRTQNVNAGAWRASQLIGINVYSIDGSRVGSIADMVGEVKGRVLYLVLSHGGVLGIGDKLIPLPWEMISPGGQAGTLKVRLSKEALERAPNFDSKKWPDFTQSDWKAKTEKYYANFCSKKRDKSQK